MGEAVSQRKKQRKKKKKAAASERESSGDAESFMSGVFRQELENSRAREQAVLEVLHQRFASALGEPDLPAAGSIAVGALSEAISTMPPPLAPPPLEPLAVEGNVIMGLAIQRPAALDRADRRAAFAVVCEVLTFLQTEFALEHAERYRGTPRFSPLPLGPALNPHRMRCLSEHSWALLLLLEADRDPPRQRVFSEGPGDDDLAVWGWDVASAREQLRRDGWFGYDFRLCERAFVRSKGRWQM